MRAAFNHHGTGFDVVVSADNSLPHLLSDEDLLTALRQMAQSVPVGGGCVITVRDYALEARGRDLVKPHGVRVDDGQRHLLFQVWDFDGDLYDLAFFIVTEDLGSGAVSTRTFRSRYYAITTERLMRWMEMAGFGQVRRLDGVFFQPVLIGTRVV